MITIHFGHFLMVMASFSYKSLCHRFRLTADRYQTDQTIENVNFSCVIWFKRLKSLKWTIFIQSWRGWRLQIKCPILTSDNFEYVRTEYTSFRFNMQQNKSNSNLVIIVWSLNPYCLVYHPTAVLRSTQEDNHLSSKVSENIDLSSKVNCLTFVMIQRTI